MHQLCCPDDRIDRTGLDTQSTTDTSLLIDDDHGLGFFLAIVRIQRFGFTSQQVSQDTYAILTTRWTLVYIRFFFCDRLRIGTTAWEAALAALGLWQQGIYPVHHGVRFNPEIFRRPAEAETKGKAQ